MSNEIRITEEDYAQHMDGLGIMLEMLDMKQPEITGSGDLATIIAIAKLELVKANLHAQRAWVLVGTLAEHIAPSPKVNEFKKAGGDFIATGESTSIN